MFTRGGRIVLADQDFESVVVNSADPPLTRTIVTAFADALPNGRVGSRMPSLLTETGFTDIEVSAFPLLTTDLSTVDTLLLWPAAAAAVANGSVSHKQAEQWQNDIRAQADKGTFLFAVIMLVTTARRPY